MAKPAAERLPAYLRSIDPDAPYGTRAKVADGLRNIVERLQTASDKQARALETERKALMNLNQLYLEDIRWEQGAELVERVRELEAQLAAQQTGDPIDYVGKDSPFSGRTSETAH